MNWLRDPRSGHSVQSRESVFGLSVEIVLERYRGIEGDPWPLDLESFEIELDGGLAPLHQLDRVRKLSIEAARGADMDLLYVSVERSISEVPVLPADFQFEGYDVGVLESETNLYSVLVNEVIFGSQPELMQFAARLNSSLLLPGDGSVQELLQVRERLQASGADLESWEEGERILSIRIHAPPRRPS